MNTLLLEAFSPANIFITLLFLLIVLYWIFVILGTLDLDFLDFDLDLDADVDADVDVDVDAGSSGAGTGTFVYLLHFFNVGAIPFMIYLSLLILVIWNFSILANYYIPNRALPLGLLLIIPNIVVSLFVTKILTAPLLPFFKSMNVRQQDTDLIGQLATTISPVSDMKMGQAEISIDNNFLTLNIKTKKGSLPRGTKVVFIAQNKAQDFYFVEETDDEF
ncbi:MAG: hypothetical protein ACPG5B_13715 [Chitinophagales bacterium]